jgi:uncharacterized protein (TIGR00369 family)
LALSPAIIEKVHNSFDAQSMMHTIGARIDTIEAGLVSISAPILPGCTQQAGYGHAALSFALGDTAAGYAALSVMPEEAEVLTSEIKINLIAPAQGDRLIARGRVIKPGRRLVIVQSDVYAVTDGHETHIAVCLGTMVPILPK